MGLEHLALGRSDDLPIIHDGPVHSGKVRSVYWLTLEDSARIIADREYACHPDAQLGAMVITDKVSAFDCNWRAEDGLVGVPGKGAALNTLSAHWFRTALQPNHLVDTPHPLVWIVQRSQPVLVEAIARDYIMGSMWRKYSEGGKREFNGATVPDGLQKNQKLPELLLTPSTKGVMRGIPGIPENEDVAITDEQIKANYEKFRLQSPADLDAMNAMNHAGFIAMATGYKVVDQLLADHKFEFGYMQLPTGKWVLAYIDEAGTPDSSRVLDGRAYREGRILEKSKELLREKLMAGSWSDTDGTPYEGKKLMTDDALFEVRKRVAKNTALPVAWFSELSAAYTGLAEHVTGRPLPKIENAREEIVAALKPYGIIE